MKFKFAIIGLLLAAVLLAGCTKTQNKTGKITNLDAEGFKEFLDSNEQVFLLDTHIPEQQHIKGTSAFVPYNELEENIDKLPDDKSTPIAVYCRSGSMSKSASETLVDLGYENVINLVGGANAWRSSGYDFEE